MRDRRWHGGYYLSPCRKLPSTSFWRIGRLFLLVAGSWSPARAAQPLAPQRAGGAWSEDGETTLDVRLKAVWEDRQKEEPQLFRFKLDARVTLRDIGRFVAHLCPGRATKRPLGRDIDHVVSSFDAEKFHFGKVDSRELMTTFEAGTLVPEQFPQQAVQTTAKSAEDSMMSIARLPPSTTAIFLNVSPILRYHFVFAPFAASLLPQVLSREALQAAGAFLTHAGASCRLLYNSLGGAASVNHLHFQGYYMGGGDGFPALLPLERQPIAWRSKTLGQVPSWPLHTVVVSEKHFEDMATAAQKVIARLLQRNIAHHLLLVRKDGLYQTYIIARRLQHTFHSAFINVAVNEAVGWFICPDKKEYAGLNERQASSMLGRWRLSDEAWQAADVFYERPESAHQGGSTEL
eukprot:TRINITY_DN20564_c0_g1_i3.p1 TRINITY_DN20564_c0_g1~~TRINITY_DN20564_c0_g1_i3.p1  ORF type:complete len:404 (+),score=84.27 TRINITY_DN20564_c0_g1_i3:202-1413(+)